MMRVATRRARTHIARTPCARRARLATLAGPRERQMEDACMRLVRRHLMCLGEGIAVGLEPVLPGRAWAIQDGQFMRCRVLQQVKEIIAPS